MEQSLDRLVTLAEQVGEKGWPLLVQYQQNVAMSWLLFCFLTVVLAGIMARPVWRKGVDEYGPNGPQITYILVFGGAGLFATMGLFIEVIPVLLNPEAAAVGRLLHCGN